MKPTLFLAALVVSFALPTALADTKDKLLHAQLVEELGGNEVKEFSADVAKIYALWKGDTVKAGDKVRGVWIATDVGEAAPKDTKIDEATVTANASTEGQFSLSKPNKGWPVGEYRLELYVGDKLAQTLKFTITEEGD